MASAKLVMGLIRGEAPTILEALDEGADINGNNVIPLHITIKMNDTGLMRTLLDKGADVNGRRYIELFSNFLRTL